MTSGKSKSWRQLQFVSGASLSQPISPITSYSFCSHPVAGTYDEFVEDLREAEDKRECRYGVFDAEYELQNGEKRSKLVFFLW